VASITNRAWLVMAVALAGCAGTPPSTSPTSLPSQVPIATPVSTTARSPEVSPTPTEPPSTPLPACEGGAPTGPFEPDSIVCVVEGPLRVRSRPSTSDDSLKFEPLLQTGHLLFVIDGPAEGSGYTWYQIQETPGSFGRAAGWVAADAKDGTPWLAQASMPCPADPSLQDLQAMDALQRLHCYHAREFTFTDTVIAGPMCGDGNFLKSPTWMAGCGSTFWWGERPYQGAIVAIPPDLADDVGPVELPEGRFEATITAHMDDPAARTCLPYEGLETDYELLNPGTILFCRSMFVATSIQRITP
jgi:hypothetical protein